MRPGKRCACATGRVIGKSISLETSLIFSTTQCNNRSNLYTLDSSPMSLYSKQGKQNRVRLRRSSTLVAGSNNPPDIRGGWLCYSTPLVQDSGSPIRNWSSGHRFEAFMQAARLGPFVFGLGCSFLSGIRKTNFSFTASWGFRLIGTSVIVDSVCQAFRST